MMQWANIGFGLVFSFFFNVAVVTLFSMWQHLESFILIIERDLSFGFHIGG